MTLIWAGKSQADVLEYLYIVATHGHCPSQYEKDWRLKMVLGYERRFLGR